MKTKSYLFLLVMLFALGITTFSCKKEKSSTPTNPINPSQNEIIGYINGLYSVTPNTQVCFSKGNLQYQASTNTWRFAENQWDIIGADQGQNCIFKQPNPYAVCKGQKNRCPNTKSRTGPCFV